MPPSILNSRKASSISLLVNFSPQVISEWRNISASIWPLISKASNDLIITWSSSVPPDIFSAKRVTIWVKLMVTRRLAHHVVGLGVADGAADA